VFENKCTKVGKGTLEGINKEVSIKKKLLVAGTAATIGLTSILGIGLASAQNKTNGQSDLVDKIAQKFNLNKNDVQKVFDENRTAHEAEHEQKVKERLDQAVKNGTLTQDQENKIIAKLQELKAKRDSLKDKTPAERREAMKAERDALKQWAKDNNIPEQYLMPHHGGMHGGMKEGGPPPEQQ
jgi:hypothetical protein